MRIRCWAYLLVSSTVYHRSLTSVGKISLKNNSGEASAGRSVRGPVGCVKGGHWRIVSVSAMLHFILLTSIFYTVCKILYLHFKYLTFIARSVGGILCETKEHSRSEMKSNRQTDTQTDNPNYRNPRCTCAPRVKMPVAVMEMMFHLHVYCC